MLGDFKNDFNDDEDDEFQKEIFEMLDDLEEKLQDDLEWDLFFGMAERWFNKGRYPIGSKKLEVGDYCSLVIGGNEIPIFCYIMNVDINEGVALVKEENSDHEFSVPIYSLEKTEQ